MTVRWPRRGFLERLGLGAGATLLAPIARTLVGEARGQGVARRRCFFYLVGNGIDWEQNFSPPEWAPTRTHPAGRPAPEGTRAFTWPAMINSLARHRERVALVDGLANVPRTGDHTHTAGYAALSCFPSPGGLDNETGPPGGTTIDQFIADGIGRDTRFRSILFGASGLPGRQTAGVFARGVRAPLPHTLDPAVMFDDLFGALLPDPDGVRRGAISHRIVMDGLRTDVARMQRALAAPERSKLDGYLATVEEMDRRLAKAGACQARSDLRTEAQARLGPEERLALCNEMAIVALACGMTNVLGMAAWTGYSHQTLALLPRLSRGLAEPIDGAIGHAPRAVQQPALDRFHDFHAGLIARLIDVLAEIPEGNGTAADTLLGIYTSDNGEAHHARKDRWPVVLLGAAGGRLRTGGRFFRFPARENAGARSLADFFCTLACAAGRPTDRFGAGGNEPVQGPIEAFLA